MKSVLFHNINQSKSIAKHFKKLFSDYQFFKKKHFTQLCLNKLNTIYQTKNLWLTHSATAGLEIIATLLNVRNGDEIIMPSYTYVSTANAFVGKGAVPVFIDIKPNNLNINEKLIEQAITSKTKAVIAMHYAGVACNLTKLKDICKKHNIALIEDAAMSFGCNYQKKPLGTIGDFGVISFDITKQISAIQGGLLLVNNKKYIQRTDNIYNVGTNRQAFEKGEVKAYQWIDLGSKYQMSELSATVLWNELNMYEKTLLQLSKISTHYYKQLLPILMGTTISLLKQQHYLKNKHSFPLICSSASTKNKLIAYLSKQKIQATSHYQPLHKSQMGKQFKQQHQLPVTQKIAETIVRIPFYAALKTKDINHVITAIKTFVDENK